ncbi:hypothetical protein Ahy_A04g018347 isoform B [Arachis hypogaea]|uniref:CCHC-type domain-containing protein n=1 Tax=Arachis hypogaea TaxID=3818 RepID=A0A445DDE9_ARAHY|nr:hypothetical protein Ahy_A04g018347 isoform B [Arachis hypogaea]
MNCSTGYSRTEQEYNKNYQRLKEWGEAYTQWCDNIGVEIWVLAFDGGHCWEHMTTNFVECINSVLKGARNLPVTAIVRSTFYRLNELFTRKSAEAHELVRNRFTYSKFATKRVEESFRRAENIVVNRRTTKGIPKSTRYLNEMDSRDVRGPRRCTICGREGHSRSRCPHHAGPSSARGH